MKLTEMECEGDLNDKFIARLKAPAKEPRWPEPAEKSVHEVELNFTSTSEKWRERPEREGIIQILEKMIPREVCEKISKSVCFGLSSFSNDGLYEMENRAMMQFVMWMDLVEMRKLQMR